MTTADSGRLRDQLQELVTHLGRDDIGVGEVTEANGRVRFSLTRGDHALKAEMPIDVLKDHDRALAAMLAIVPGLSKAIEREHMEAAHS
jgi:hypothetical protein